MEASRARVAATDSFGALDGVDELVFAVRPGPDGALTPLGAGGAEDLLAGYGLDVETTLDRLDLGATPGSSAVLTLPALPDDDRWDALPGRLRFVVLPDPDAPDGVARARALGATLVRGAEPDAVLAVAGLAAEPVAVLAALAEGAELAAYRAPFTGRSGGPAAPPAQLRLVGAPEAAVATGLASAAVALTARTLAATPSNVKNPAWLAGQAQALARGIPHVRVVVRDENWIERAGLGGLAAVGRGSATPPRLVVVEYAPPGARPGEVLLVGKGITFDTGGLAVKPRESMVNQKTDMTGAAVALAAVLGAARAKLPVGIAAVLPLAENALGGASYRPGDVVTLVDGTSVEIGNPDAEGRIVLADGLAWGRATYAPEVILDVATLTGAAALGLGKGTGALYATDDVLAAEITAAGAEVGEALWRMPLAAEYLPLLASEVADTGHIANDRHAGAGSIVAALFLRRFVGEVPWAHLDIAGPGRSPRSAGILPEGATGFGARTLLRWLADRSV